MGKKYKEDNKATMLINSLIEAHRKLNKGHKDAFLDSGKGFGATYRQLIFPFRIDFILVDNLSSAYNFKVLEKKLSDHQAIRCDVEFN